MKGRAGEPDEIGPEEPEEEPGRTPPPPPDDRLWRHPSEVARLGPRRRAVPRWAPAGVAALAGAAVASAVLVATGWGVQRVTVVVAPTTTTTTSTAAGVLIGPHLAQAAKEAQASLVRVEVGPSGRQHWATGTVVDAGGMVLTSATLMGPASAATVVTASGRRIPAQVQASDPEADLVVLSTGTSGLPWLRMDGVDTLTPGDVALATAPAAAGAPSSLGAVVSAGQPYTAGGTALIDSIVVNTAIPATAVGGVLLDAQGDVVGLTVLAGSASGAGSGCVAVPASLIVADLGQVAATGSVQHGWLGVALGAGDGAGVPVLTVVAGSPAASAGIQAGDVIRALNGQPVTSTSQLKQAISLKAPGARITLVLSRAGRPHDASITLSSQPPTSP